MKVNVLGDAFCDVVVHNIAHLPQFGQGARCDGVVLSPGGSALNTAVHVAHLLKTAGSASQVTLFSALGESEEDWASKTLCSHLETYGVAFEFCRIPKQASGVCVVLSGQSDRAFVTTPGFFYTISSVST
jgi:sugar/nucleoside kinase (ribokinase family)